MDMFWYEQFLANVVKYPERGFVRHLGKDTERRWTYVQGAMQVVAIMDRLREAGLSRGDRVIWFEEHPIPCLFFKLSCAFAGLAYSPLAPATSSEALSRLAKRLDARAVLTTPAYEPKVKECGLEAFCHSHAPTAVEPTDAAYSVARLRESLIDRTSGEVQCYMPTSGTTSDPKLSKCTYGRQYAPDWGAMRGFKVEPQERILLCASFAHEAANNRFRAALSLAPEFVVPSAIEAKTPLAEVQALDPTAAMVNPRVVKALYRQHVDAQGDPKVRFFGPSLRFLRTSGGKTDLELLKVISTHGVDVGEEYGSTETGPICYTPLRSWRPGYLTLLPWVEGKVARDGELLVRSPTLIQGYASSAETADLFTSDGFVKTGDIVELEGRSLCHKGRKKEVLNAPDGTNIYAVRIEDRIAALPWVDQVVLVGDQKPYLAALIVVRDEVKSSEADGFLSETAHPSLYQRAAKEMAVLNENLEGIEKVRRVALFAQAMPTDMYRITATGKVGRVRHRIDSAYAGRIERLYAP